MIGRLDRYVSRVFVLSLAAAALFAAGLLVLTDQFQHLDDVIAAPKKLRAAGAMKLADQVPLLAVRYYGCWITIRFLQFAPFVTFLAATFTAARLHRSNETVAMLACGVSLQRAFAPLFVGALALGVAQLAFRETILPKMAREVVLLDSILLKGKPSFELRQLWVSDSRGHQILLGTYRPESQEGETMQAYGGSEEGERIVTATAFRWIETSESGRGVWKLTGGQSKSLTRGSGTADPDVDHLPAEFLLTPHDCDVAVRFTADRFYLTLGELDEQARRNPQDARLQIILHWTITMALANLILPLLGLPFLLRLDRRSAIEGVAIALALCVVYFGASMFCMELGVEEAFGPVVAAWLPVVVFGSLGIALFESMHT